MKSFAKKDKLHQTLDRLVEHYNQSSFIDTDPIQVPHAYNDNLDIEIVGFFTAIFSWGQRKTIINKSKLFAAFLGDKPTEFVLNFTEKDLSRFEFFKHRTFNFVDAKGFLWFLQDLYRQDKSLEDYFIQDRSNPIENGLNTLYNDFSTFHLSEKRSQKHIGAPQKKSACKRLNMFLRWMVRKDEYGVDFGIWQRIDPCNLIIPLDVHVYRTALEFGLLKRKKTDWEAAIELTNTLKIFDASDPVRFDYALFSLTANPSSSLYLF